MSSLSEGFSRLSFGDLKASSSPSNPDTVSSLDRVARERDVLVDEDHQVMDKEVLKVLHPYRHMNIEPDLPSLLVHIACGDERLVPLNPKEAAELLKRKPTISTILQKAWKGGSFKEVRQLGACVTCSSIRI
jgi:hypothetical protein